MKFQTILNELTKTTHYALRTLKRLNYPSLPLVFIYNDNIFPPILIGEYIISEDVNKEIWTAIDLVNSYTFPHDKTFAVVLHRYDLNNFEHHRYKEVSDKLLIKNLVKTGQGKLYFYEPGISNKDDTLIGIIREDKIVTIQFISYSRLSTDKVRVDKIIENLDDLPKYTTRPSEPLKRFVRV